MIDDSDINRLISSMASGEPVDWEAAKRRATNDQDGHLIDALRGIEQIAAFSHAQWEEFSPLFGDALDTDGAAAAEGVAPTIEPLAGQVIGAYTLESPIGEGGMGTVWLARRSDGRFEARAAVKLLHLPRVGRAGVARFEREGQILARLRHANIAQLMDAGVTPGGQPYLVLEHVDGVSIDRYCDIHGLDVRGRIKLFLDVLRAVAHAQTNLVLHRDLKPSNVLVDASGQVKLLDFGIAKLLEDENVAAVETELTQRAGHAFTPEFAAPEQLQSESVTTATDVYAAGVLLYLLLTGKHPTGGVRGSPLERMQAVLESSPKLASDAVTAVRDDFEPAGTSPPRDARASLRLRRELQGDLDNILAKALKKNPEERYANAAAFAGDLRRYLNQEPVTARADTITYRVGKFVRRHRAAVAGASVAVVALVGLALVAVAGMLEARRQRDEARAQTQRAEAFNNVVTSLLSQVGPGGRALSPEELLDRAVAEMQTQYAEDPQFLVDMLIRISGRYLDLRNNTKELSTLVRAEEIARKTGDPVLIFRVQTNTVETELALGHKNEARQRMEEARRLLPTLHPTPSVHDYLRAEAELAKAEGNIPVAIEYLEKGRQALEDADRTSGNSYHGILSVLRLYYWLAGDMPRAYEYALRMIETNKLHHHEESVAGITARALLGVSLYSVGEVERGRLEYEAAIPELKDWQPEKPTSWKSMMWSYGEILSRQGRHETAVPMTQEAFAAVSQGGNRMNSIRAGLALSRALLRAGRVEEAEPVLDEAVARMKADEAANRVWLIEASRVRAEMHLARQRLDEALQEANAALERIGYPRTQRGFALPQTLLTRARVERAQGRATQAVETARAAVQLFEQDALDPSASADVGEALFVLAQSQLALGDRGGAEQSLARALPALRSGFGAEHAVTRESERLAGGLH